MHVPRLPTLSELAEIGTGQAGEHHEWPPPGMGQLTPVGSTAYVLTGEASEPGWWWSSCAEINPAITGVEAILAVLGPLGVAIPLAVRTAVRVLGWVPLVYEQGAAMDWIKVGIHGNLGTSEQLIHSICLTPSGGAPAALPADAAALRAVATEVATAWSGMWELVKPPSNQPTEDFKYGVGTYLTYDAVTASVLHQSEPSPKKYVKGQPNLVSTVVPTERVGFPVPLVGGAINNAMPYEVAMACTLLTRQAGPSARGRLYIGGLCVGSVSGPDGLFTDTAVSVIGYGVGKFVELMRTNTPWQVAIVSRRTLTTHEVVRVATGHVPDSQRRRRGNQTENRVTQWTSPTI